MSLSTSSSDRLLRFPMGIGFLMHVPLVRDIWLQKEQVKIFMARLTLFTILLGVLDRLNAEFLVGGLERAYGLDVPAKVLCIGHSHTALGIDQTALERELGVPVAKYARNGANVADRLIMIRQYIERQPSSVRVLVYDVSADIFTGGGLSLNSYTLFYPFMDSPSVDTYVRQHASFADYYIRRALMLRRFDLETCNAALRGWLRAYANLKRGTVNIERLQKAIATAQIRRISFDDDCIRCFEETLRLVSGKAIHVVLLYIPTIDLYNEAEPDKYQHAIGLLREYSMRCDGVTFLDYSSVFAHRHELFYDPVHLNPEGQRLVTQRLAQDIKSILIRISDGSSEYAPDGP